MDILTLVFVLVIFDFESLEQMPWASLFLRLYSLVSEQIEVLRQQLY